MTGVFICIETTQDTIAFVAVDQIAYFEEQHKGPAPDMLRPSTVILLKGGATVQCKQSAQDLVKLIAGKQ